MNEYLEEHDYCPRENHNKVHGKVFPKFYLIISKEAYAKTVDRFNNTNIYETIFM